MGDKDREASPLAELNVTEEQARYLATMLRRAISGEVAGHGPDTDEADNERISSFTRLISESAALALEGKDFLEVMEQAARTWSGDEEQERRQAVKMRERADRELVELAKLQEARIAPTLEVLYLGVQYGWRKLRSSYRVLSLYLRGFCNWKVRLDL